MTQAYRQRAERSFPVFGPPITLERESGDVSWHGADVPGREAFGVRGACSRFGRGHV